MKNCDEMVHSLLERREAYVAEQTRKRIRIVRTAASVCCVCLVALLGFEMWQGGVFLKQPTASEHPADIENKDKTKPDTPNREPTQESKDNQQSTHHNSGIKPGDNRKLLFGLNEITGTVTAAPRYYDPDFHYKETWDFQKSVRYLGVNIPEAVNAVFGDRYLKPVNTDAFPVTFRNDGTMVEDSMCYAFAGTNSSAKLTVLVSKLRPPYDCIYHSDTKHTTPIGIPGTNKTVTALVYSKDKSFFVIDFAYNGNYYRITADDVESIGLLNTLVLEMVQ